MVSKPGWNEGVFSRRTGRSWEKADINSTQGWSFRHVHSNPTVSEKALGVGRGTLGRMIPPCSVRAVLGGSN